MASVAEYSKIYHTTDPYQIKTTKKCVDRRAYERKINIANTLPILSNP